MLELRTNYQNLRLAYGQRLGKVAKPNPLGKVRYTRYNPRSQLNIALAMKGYMPEHFTERIETVRLENETRVPYIDDDLDSPAYVGTLCIPMATALVHIYSEDGLVVAADGFNFMRSDAGMERTSECAQKIYELSGKDRHVACSLTGRVTIFNKADEKVFDFASACCDAARTVESAPARDANDLAAQILPLIQQRLTAVKESGKLDRYPSPMRRQVGQRGSTMVHIHLDGYFNGLPFRAGIRFFHDNQELGWEPSLHELNPWRKSLFYGLPTVTDLLLKTEDLRLEKYRTPACRFVAARQNNPDIAISLQDAIEAARNIIGACSDPVAPEIEGEAFQRIGGHILVATITPKDGFRWVPGCEPIPPSDVFPQSAPIR